MFQKVLDGYCVGFLDWSSNDMYAMDTELALIYQRKVITKTPPAMASAAVISVSDHRCKIPTSHLIGIHDPYFHLYNKLFRERIKILYEGDKFFLYGNRHLEPGKCLSILEDCYLMTKDVDGTSDNMESIRPYYQKTTPLFTSETLDDTSTES